MIEQTNLYAALYKRGNANLPPNSRANSWEETNRNETKKFLALVHLMGIVRKPEVSDYWSRNPLLKGSIFNSVMPRNHFQSILQFLHFADNSRYDANDPNHDKLYKVRSVVEYLVSKVQECLHSGGAHFNFVVPENIHTPITEGISYRTPPPLRIFHFREDAVTPPPPWKLQKLSNTPHTPWKLYSSQQTTNKRPCIYCLARI